MVDKQSYGKIYGRRNVGNVRQNIRVSQSFGYVPSVPSCPACRAPSDSLQCMRLGGKFLNKYRCKRCSCIFKDFDRGRRIEIYQEGKKR